MNNETTENTVMKSLLNDRRSDRRWRNIRFAGWMFVLLLYAILIFAPTSAQLTTKVAEPYASLVRLNGTIMSNTFFSARRVIPELQNAFSDKDAKGVVLLINS